MIRTVVKGSSEWPASPPARPTPVTAQNLRRDSSQTTQRRAGGVPAGSGPARRGAPSVATRNAAIRRRDRRLPAQPLQNVVDMGHRITRRSPRTVRSDVPAVSGHGRSGGSGVHRSEPSVPASARHSARQRRHGSTAMNHSTATCGHEGTRAIIRTVGGGWSAMPVSPPRRLGAARSREQVQVRRLDRPRSSRCWQPVDQALSAAVEQHAGKPGHLGVCTRVALEQLSGLRNRGHHTKPCALLRNRLCGRRSSEVMPGGRRGSGRPKGSSIPARRLARLRGPLLAASITPAAAVHGQDGRTSSAAGFGGE